MTGFPHLQDMDMLLHELRNARFFDVFEYNGVEQQWGCFLCNHPDRARGFVDVSVSLRIPKCCYATLFTTIIIKYLLLMLMNTLYFIL